MTTKFREKWSKEKLKTSDCYVCFDLLFCHRGNSNFVFSYCRGMSLWYAQKANVIQHGLYMMSARCVLDIFYICLYAPPALTHMYYTQVLRAVAWLQTIPRANPHSQQRPAAIGRRHGRQVRAGMADQPSHHVVTLGTHDNFPGHTLGYRPPSQAPENCKHNSSQYWHVVHMGAQGCNIASFPKKICYINIFNM